MVRACSGFSVLRFARLILLRFPAKLSKRRPDCQVEDIPESTSTPRELEQANAGVAN